jgi:hypothetical protein
MYEYIDNILILLQIFCFMKISKNEDKTRSLSVILFNNFMSGQNDKIFLEKIGKITFKTFLRNLISF